ncbi:MAG: hypothetical protein U9N77_07480 [Thermodesulfobacteriota bacterium]|nr:hypothetical protein [Thermodesulfobacteriota bacterium]
MDEVSYKPARPERGYRIGHNKVKKSIIAVVWMDFHIKASSILLVFDIVISETKDNFREKGICKPAKFFAVDPADPAFKSSFLISNLDKPEPNLKVTGKRVYV